MRINWAKIDLVTYDLSYLSAEGKEEYQKVLDEIFYADRLGDKRRVRYLTKRLDDKSNYRLQF